MHALSLAALLMAACVPQQKIAETSAPIWRQPLSCREALASEKMLAPLETAGLLDENYAEQHIEECWIPLMQKALDQKDDLPLAHLANALKVFNKQRHQRYFHLATYRYFSALIKGSRPYGPEDRQLLEMYCRYVINVAANVQDPNLSNAKLLCRRLDRDLYARLFE
jgi:hypothetical protein